MLVTMPERRPQPEVPVVQVGALRSDGVFVWQNVKSRSAVPEYVEPPSLPEDLDKETYEKSLKAKQAAHYQAVWNRDRPGGWRPCLHDLCEACHGTGVKSDGSKCVHGIVCTCKKCESMRAQGM